MHDKDSMAPERSSRKSVSLGWVQKALDRLDDNKANKETVKADIRRVEASVMSLDEDVKEVKDMCKEAQDTADMPHECRQENTLVDLKQRTTDLVRSTENMSVELGRWIWFRKATIPVGGAALALAITAIIAFVRLGSDVVDTKESVHQVSTEVTGLKAAVETERATGVQQINKIADEVRQAISDAKTVTPVSADIKPKPRGRGRHR